MTLVELLVVITATTSLACLLVPAVASVREAARRTVCGNNVRQVSTALLQYESASRRLPENSGLAWTQRIAATSGVAALNASPLASASEPDRERLLHVLPEIFCCPSALTKTVATYPGAHVGHNFLLLGKRMADVTDGASKTMLVGELKPFLGAPWVIGPTVDEAQFGSDHRTGGHYASADGGVKFLTSDESETCLAALLSPNGGTE